MTPSISTANWGRPALIGLSCILLILAWTYVAGGIFLVAFDREITEATPLTLYQYWRYYGEHQSVRDWLFIAGAGALLVCLGPLKLIFARAKKSLYGKARFATHKEIKEAGLFGEQGVIVGKLAGRYLIFGGQQHAIISAPTRSGKGVGIVIPNLLNWPDSVVVLDIKQENWDITSAYRNQHGQKCYLFNPLANDYRTHRYNPLAYISEDENFRVDDIQKIANMLYPDKSGTDPIWTVTPRALFLGIVLYLLETPGKPVTLGQVLRETLTDGDGAAYFARIIRMRELAASIKNAPMTKVQEQAKQDGDFIVNDPAKLKDRSYVEVIALWYHMRLDYRTALLGTVTKGKKANTPDVAACLDNTEYDKEAAAVASPLSASCVQALNSYLSISAEKTRAGVLISVRASLELWMNPLVDMVTSANDFDLRDVRKKRMSIYLGVTPDNLVRSRPLLNLFFQQLIDLNTRELPEQNPQYRYQCLLLMDEFPALGRIEALSKGIAYIAGYGLRLMPVLQSPAQIIEIYGKHAADTFAANHALNIVFAPKASDTQTARDISEWLGYETVKGTSKSRRTELFEKRQRSESLSDQRRALLLPQEVVGIGKKAELLILEHVPPIDASKIRYYEESVFLNRLREVAPTLRKTRWLLPRRRQLAAAIAQGELRVPVASIQIKHLSGTGRAKPHAPVSKTATVEHTITAADMPALSETSLEQYQVEWAKQARPEPGDMNEEILSRYSNGLVESFPLRALNN